MNRIFIEIDPDNEYNKSQLKSSMRGCLFLHDIDSDGERFFDRVICEARFEPNLFEYIRLADEIYMDSSLMPLVTYTRIGAPELWDTMMAKAAEAGLEKKSVYIKRELKDIDFENIDAELLDRVFRKNFLYVANYDTYRWEQVDIDSLLKRLRQ